MVEQSGKCARAQTERTSPHRRASAPTDPVGGGGHQRWHGVKEGRENAIVGDLDRRETGERERERERERET